MYQCSLETAGKWSEGMLVSRTLMMMMVMLFLLFGCVARSSSAYWEGARSEAQQWSRTKFTQGKAQMGPGRTGVLPLAFPATR